MPVARPSDIPPAVARVEACVRDFDQDVGGARRALREIFETDLECFRRASARLMKKPDAQSRGLRYLLAMLVNHGEMPMLLCDPSLSVDEAIEAARAAMQVNPMLDAVLARHMTDAASPEGDRQVERLLAVVAAISDLVRLAAPLTHLLRHPNRNIRSKAALLVGRATRNARWLERTLEATDWRVRANAVEALWGADSAGVRDVLRVALKDSHNRVAGNALVALHRLGDTAALTEVVRMAGHPQQAFRATAAWAMAEIGDPRFAGLLAKMLGESEPLVRKRAFASVQRVREAAARQQRQDTLTVALGQVTAAAPGFLKAKVGVAASTGDDPDLLPTQFVITEDGEPVFDYSVEPLVVPEVLSLALILPVGGNAASAWVSGLQACLSRKRPADTWCLLRYSDDSPDQPETAFEPARFSAEGPVLAAALQASGREVPAGFWNSLRRAVSANGVAPRGVRHVLVLNTANRSDPPDIEDLLAAARVQRVTIHTLSMAASPALDRLCNETNGVVRIASAEIPISVDLTLAYLQMLPRYSLTWRCGSNPQSVKLQIRDVGGWGQDSARIRL